MQLLVLLEGILAHNFEAHLHISDPVWNCVFKIPIAQQVLANGQEHELMFHCWDDDGCLSPDLIGEAGIILSATSLPRGKVVEKKLTLQKCETENGKPAELFVRIKAVDFGFDPAGPRPVAGVPVMAQYPAMPGAAAAAVPVYPAMPGAAPVQQQQQQQQVQYPPMPSKANQQQQFASGYPADPTGVPSYPPMQQQQQPAPPASAAPVYPAQPEKADSSASSSSSSSSSSSDADEDEEDWEGGSDIDWEDVTDWKASDDN